MTKAYVIAHLTLTNPDRFRSEYMSKVGAVTEAFGGNYLVRGGDVSYQESESLGDRTVVIQFPSRDAALAWINSEQYQAIIKDRTENSIGSLIIIDGVPE